MAELTDQPCVPKNEQNQGTNTTSQRHKRLSLRRLKTYIPHTKVQKLKAQKIPRSTPQKLVVMSNYQGNGFRNHFEDIQQFQASQRVRQQIKHSLKRLSKECFLVWKSKKVPSQARRFRFQKWTVNLISVLLLALAVILVVLDVEQSRVYAVSAFVIICLICVSSLFVSLSSLFKRYSENSLQTDINNTIKKTLKSLNQNYFMANSLVWKMQKEGLWVSLNLLEASQIDSQDSTGLRKETQANLND